ncbi:MAG: polysaccharide biosynthesis C-terminal domain-containing protein [Clostridia bacterium]|nr:polysaccharide biosynthesis C-terminal domain-containing protein [Clostridia bacterium]
MMKREQTFEVGAAMLLASSVAVKLMGALFKIPLSSNLCLGDLGFGYFSSVYDLFSPLYALAMAGLPCAVAKLVSENAARREPGANEHILSLSKRVYTLIGLTGAIGILLFAFPFTWLSGHDPQTVWGISMLAPAMLFCCAMSSYRGYYEGLKNMAPTAVSELLEAGGKLVFGFSFAYIAVRVTGQVIWGAAAAMAGIAIGTAAAFFFLKGYHRRQGISRLAQDVSPGKSTVTGGALLWMALPIALASLSGNMASLIDALTVERGLALALERDAQAVWNVLAPVAGDQPMTVAELPTFLYGLRAKAYTLYNLVPSFAAVLAVSAVPAVAGAYVTGDTPKTVANIRSVCRLSAMMAFPAAAGFLADGPALIRLLYDTPASYAVSGPLLQVYGAAIIFSGLVIPLTGVLQAVGKQNAALFNIAVGALCKVAVNIVTVSIPTIHVFGAAIGTVACYAVIAILDFGVLFRTVGRIDGLPAALIKPFAAAALCGLAAFAASALIRGKIGTLLAMAAGALVYILALFSLKGFEESDFSAWGSGEKFVKFCKKHKILR